MKNRLIGTGLIALTGAALLSGCVYRTEKVTPVPAASPPTTVVVTPSPGQRVVTYPEGRYELYGDGTATAPYYWVWIPSGVTTVPTPPPLPRMPQTR